MANQKSSFELWKDGLINGISQAKWHSYDCEIKVAISEFDRHLSGSAGYSKLDWRLIKAMLWVETGAAHIQWRIKPMQLAWQEIPAWRLCYPAMKAGM